MQRDSLLMQSPALFAKKHYELMELNMLNLPNVPHSLTEQQAREVVAFLWINKPDEIYEGLKLAFNLAPKSGETVQ